MKRTTTTALSMVLAACASRDPVMPAPVIDVSQARGADVAPAPSQTPPERASKSELSQSTPREALESFVRAFDEKRWDVLVRFIPSRHQASEPITPEKLRDAWEGNMRDQMVRTVAAIRGALAVGSIEQNGPHATLVYEGGAAVLIEEDGVWKIEDFK